MIVDIDESAGQKVAKDLSAKYGKEKVKFVKTDVSNKTELESKLIMISFCKTINYTFSRLDAFEKTVDIYRQLDIVINNAGIANEVHWEKLIAVNLVRVKILKVDQNIINVTSE